METNEEEEIWRDIQGFENYQVSTLGRVKALNYHRMGKEQLLKPRIDKYGYLRVTLYQNGKPKSMLVHRLVAMAFIPNPQNLPQVNHKREGADGKILNTVENLEYCDSKYNNCYGTKIERVAKANTNGKKSKTVYQLSLEGKLIRTWPSMREVERQTGYSHRHISKCCNGRYKQAYNYKWSYNAPINS